MIQSLHKTAGGVTAGCEECHGSPLFAHGPASVYMSRHTLPVAASAVRRPPRAMSGKVQKDAVVLRLWVQRLQDVVHHDLRTGWRTGTGACVLSQCSGGRRGVGHQRACAVCVLTWGRLWQDAGGVMLWLERVGMCRTVAVSGLVVLAGGHSVCTGEGKKKKRVIIMINAIVKLPLLVLPVKSTVTLGPHIQCFSSKF